MPRRIGALGTLGSTPRNVWVVTIIVIAGLALTVAAAWFFTYADGPGYPVWMMSVGAMAVLGFVALVLVAFIND